MTKKVFSGQLFSFTELSFELITRPPAAHYLFINVKLWKKSRALTSCLYLSLSLPKAS